MVGMSFFHNSFQIAIDAYPQLADKWVRINHAWPVLANSKRRLYLKKKHQQFFE